jgi:transcriptional regulator with AAA-type ATPase domain
MKDTSTQQKTNRSSNAITSARESLPVPVLLISHMPEDAIVSDRYPVEKLPFTVGRSSKATLSLKDRDASREHFVLSLGEEGLSIEDLASSNGTFVNGRRLSKPRLVRDRITLIRAGQSLFVLDLDGRDLLKPPPAERFGIVGPFHATSLIGSLREATYAPRNILLAGPSGSGKELAARAFAKMLDKPLITYNAARYSSIEEATATLFGVASKRFSGVDASSGLIEQADNKVLFIDEVHNYPERVQRTFLRIMEDGRFSRIGDNRQRPIDVRFIFASNAPAPTFSLAADFLARLRLIEISPLKHRIADIPHIFRYILAQTLHQLNLEAEPVLSRLDADHFEELCLADYTNLNVRALVDVAERLATRILSGVSPEQSIREVFAQLFSDGSVQNRYKKQARGFLGSIQSMWSSAHRTPNAVSKSHYEENKELIVSLYNELNSVKAVREALQQRNISCSERWLSTYLDKWGVRPKK